MTRLARFHETARRLRLSQPAHRLVRLARSRLAVPTPPASWAGLPPLPVRSQVTFPQQPATSRLARFQAQYLEGVRALAESGDAHGASQHLARWLSERPPLGDDAWHPYVRSRRILALVEARAHGVAGVEAIVAADAAALEKTVERDVGGNHLLANGVALLRAGAALSSPASLRWRARGAAILAQCVRGQVLADGLHYERSPVYHAIVLEHLLVAMETAAARGEAPPPGVDDAAARMTLALEECLLPDGDLLRWRDGAPGMALSTPALLAWARRRAGPLGDPRRGPRAFPAAGLAILETEDGRSAATLVTAPPCPRDLPAHGHADALAYELVLDGRRVVASAGTSTYEAGPERDRERIPGASAGVLVDGRPPADPYGAFRVGARGTVRSIEVRQEPGSCDACGTSDGFLAMGVPVRHRRALALGTGPVLAAVDEWAGSGEHDVTLFWPLSVGLVAEVEGESVRVRGEGCAFRLAAPGFALAVETGRTATAMGETAERAVIVGRSRLALPARRAHAWTVGDAPATVTARPVGGREIRLDVRGASEWTGIVPAGTGR